MKTFFQSVGITFLIILFIITILASLYLSYILGIGIAIVTLFAIIYFVVKALNEDPYSDNEDLPFDF